MTEAESSVVPKKKGDQAGPMRRCFNVVMVRGEEGTSSDGENESVLDCFMDRCGHPQIARVRINRVRLSILLVVSCTEKMGISLSLYT